MKSILQWVCFVCLGWTCLGLHMPATQARPVIFLFGPPGAGKGSIGDYLQEQYGCVKLCSGDLLRHRVKAADALGQRIRQCIQRGQLVTDDIIITLLTEAVEKIDKTVPLVIDGYPQSLAQIAAIKALRQTMGGDPYFIHIHISKEMALQRMLTRRICPACAKIYTQTHQTCDRCHTSLIQREDDRLRHVAHKRLEYYEKNILPLNTVIRKTYPTFSLHAQKDFSRIQQRIQQYWQNLHGVSLTKK